MKIDKHVLNVFNKREVINIIRTHDSIYKAEIARMTGLSIPTIMKITDEFISNGLVREVGKGTSTGGKPPQMLEFIPDAKYSIGVDIGKTNIIIVLMDLASKIIQKIVVPTGETMNPERILYKVIQKIRDLVSFVNIPFEKILGIGIGIPGLIDSENGIVMFSPDFGWEHFDVITPLKGLFDVPIMIENSTRAMAMGEKWFGVAVEAEDFICVNLGYGIAASFMLDSDLYYGKSGSCGEFGHLILDKDGPICDCGNQGCLEALASGNAVAKKMKNFVWAGGESNVLQYTPNGTIDEIEAKTVYDAAKDGDEASLSIVHDALRYIGIGLAGLINIFDPEMIILSGGIVKNGDIVYDGIYKEMKTRQMKHAGRKVKLITSKLQENGTAIGAAALPIKKMIENGGVL